MSERTEPIGDTGARRASVLAVVAVAVAALLGGRAVQTAEAGAREGTARTRAALGTAAAIRRVYAEEAPAAFQVVAARERARALEAAARSESEPVRSFLRAEASVLERSARRAATRSVVTSDPAYRDRAHFDLFGRLRDVRRGDGAAARVAESMGQESALLAGGAVMAALALLLAVLWWSLRNDRLALAGWVFVAGAVACGLGAEVIL